MSLKQYSISIRYEETQSYRKIEVELNDTPHIFIDAIDLHQIMTNLLVNARDAMKSNGGIIKVKLDVVDVLTYQCAACLKPVEGRFIELSGENSSGKTTTATLMLIESQRAYPDELIGFIDIEHAINLEYAQILGLDISPERFILSQPSSAEEAFEILGAFSESNWP